ncbi:MAG TPA: N-acetyltransferase [Gammaproteobacteria bacterium]|nr:N-acetyltransferase [Gammaproteobacteria bacterium]
MTAPSHQALALHVEPVEGRRGRAEFLGLLRGIYADDPAWIQPLLLERREHLSARNPYFQHATCQAWIARRGRRPVGRITAQVDQLHLETHQDATGFFGMLEAHDDPEVFTALLDTAEHWLRAQGMRRVRGPFNLSINEESGLLVEGFDTPPMVMMGHARSYYGPRVEANGYAKVMDLLAYRLRTDFAAPPAMQALARRMDQRIRVRPLRRERFDEEVEILRGIFNDAWSGNWGFIPFTEAEFKELGRNLKLLLDDDFIQIAEAGGEPVAMAVALPNLNDAIRDLNGRLLPLGWLKLLWRLKVRCPTSGRVPLLGVSKRYQNSLLGPTLAYMVINSLVAPVRRRGIDMMELSWILETNLRMRAVIEGIGGVAYKRYRVYQKELA